MSNEEIMDDIIPYLFYEYILATSIQLLIEKIK